MGRGQAGGSGEQDPRIRFFVPCPEGALAGRARPGPPCVCHALADGGGVWERRGSGRERHRQRSPGSGLGSGVSLATGLRHSGPGWALRPQGACQVCWPLRCLRAPPAFASGAVQGHQAQARHRSHSGPHVTRGMADAGPTAASPLLLEHFHWVRATQGKWGGALEGKAEDGPRVLKLAGL